jgi:hypothetical protein
LNINRLRPTDSAGQPGTPDYLRFESGIEANSPITRGLEGGKAMATRAMSFVLLCLVIPSILSAQGNRSLEGVWEISGGRFPQGSPLVDSTLTQEQRQAIQPQPSVIIFTKGYYSQMYVMGGTPRPSVPLPADRRHATDAEKQALYDMWQPFTANAGTYEVSGSTLTLRVSVAKNVSAMTGQTPVTWTLEFDDPSTVWLIPMGVRAAIEPRLRLSRVE